MKNTKRCRRRKATEKKTNLNKKKRKRGKEKERNPNAIKSLTIARAEKLFASQGHHRDSGKRENIRGVKAEEEEGVRGRKTRRKRSR